MNKDTEIAGTSLPVNDVIEKRTQMGEMDEDERAFEGDLKIRINTLLWELLPANCTLKRAEELSCEIWQKILDVREDFR